MYLCVRDTHKDSVSLDKDMAKKYAETVLICGCRSMFSYTWTGNYKIDKGIVADPVILASVSGKLKEAAYLATVRDKNFYKGFVLLNPGESYFSDLVKDVCSESVVLKDRMEYLKKELVESVNDSGIHMVKSLSAFFKEFSGVLNKDTEFVNKIFVKSIPEKLLVDEVNDMIDGREDEWLDGIAEVAPELRERLKDKYGV